MADKSGLYPPLNRLKPVAGNVFIVDGPAIRFGPPGLKMPFPTRMTVLRLEEGLFEEISRSIPKTHLFT